MKLLTSSFRDPSGFLFEKDGELYRQINVSYFKDYDMLMTSGLYKELIDKKLLIPHKEQGYEIIKPEKIPFISYPYEWTFSQLKDTALLTLKIMKISLEHGMILKDASAYNVQFIGCKPIFIDTLSFEKYKEGEAWVAYKQFCQHFLAPLALMAYMDVRLNSLFKSFIDGIPLDLANKLLPIKAKMKPSLFMHLSLNSKFQKKYSKSKKEVS